MTYRLPDLCRSCVHLHKDRATCDAFPAGVPDSIITFGADHTVPFPGDKGILFELRKNDPDAQFNLSAWKAARQ